LIPLRIDHLVLPRDDRRQDFLLFALGHTRGWAAFGSPRGPRSDVEALAGWAAGFSVGRAGGRVLCRGHSLACHARGLPALVYKSLATSSQTLAAALLQATSLSFLVVAGQIGVQLDLIRPAASAALIAAGPLSLLLFPLTALTRLRGVSRDNATDRFAGRKS
jgi:hypothetical protein